jgi:dihydroorotate dehydrogenase
VYQLAKKFLFTMDAEEAHHFTVNMLHNLERFPGLIKTFAGAKIEDASLHRKVFGLDFKNPVGLAAGLDKNAQIVDAMSHVGFGFVEIGTVTPKPQPGNDKPRLFRLIKDEALINRMGFNNVGADVASARLANRKTDVIVGANIGKNKVTANEDAVNDYVYSFKVLFDNADYFAVNVSSPNTPGLRALQDKDSLLAILSTLQEINHGKSNKKPLLLKIAPDLTTAQLDDVLDVARATKLDGIIATNTTIERSPLSISQQEIERYGAGGLSGKPLTQKSTEVIKHLCSNGSTPVIGVGGIMTAADAKEKIAAGAELIQLYSGFIYGGPDLLRDILIALR